MGINKLAPAAGLMVLFAAGCAATTGQTTAEAPLFRHAGDYSVPGDIKTRAQTLLASSDYPGASNISLDLVQVSRAEIGAAGLTGANAHELSFAALAQAKIANIGPSAAEHPRVLIEGGGANGGWVDEGGSLRHTYSGMVCPKTMLMLFAVSEDTSNFSTMPLTGIQLYDESGLDTSCNYESKTYGVYLTLYASKWRDVSLDDHFAGALRDIVDRFSIASESSAITAAPKIEDGQASSIEGETKAAAYILEPINGMTLKTILWLNKTGDWHVKARATYAMPQAGTEMQFVSTELFAAVTYAAKLGEVDRHINSGALTQVKYQQR